jgi:hypothetical protein
MNEHRQQTLTRIVLSVVFALITMQSLAQVDRKKDDPELTQNFNSATYRLYPTQNIWTYIKLNTRNGQMWQVQFDLKDNRFVTSLSQEYLVPMDKEVNGRFCLYPTQNVYTFILLDQSDGRTWQVQWSADPKNRGILPIL